MKTSTLYAVAWTCVYLVATAESGQPPARRNSSPQDSPRTNTSSQGSSNAVSSKPDETQDRILRVALPDPGNLSSFRAQNLNGMSLLFRIVGSTLGSVWGDGVYTDDSRLSAAAVHAGLIRSGERAIVRVVFLSGLPSYVGAARNGVNSSSYGAWDASYRMELVRSLGVVAKLNGGKATVKAAKVVGDVLPDPGALSGYRGRRGQSFLFRVTGATAGTVWGSGVYTDDSRLSAAAVHAGVLRVGETAVLRVTILPGRKKYGAAVRNGVTTHSYGAWSGSYKIERVKKSDAKSTRK